MLDDDEIAEALAAGEARAQVSLAAGLIEVAVLQLCGMLRIVGALGLDTAGPPQLRAAAA